MCPVSAAANSVTEPVDLVGVRCRSARRQGREVGAWEVEPQHPVGAVVDDQRRHAASASCANGRQLAAGEQEAAVAADRDDGAGAGHGRPDRGREGEAQRAPAHRVLEPARRGERVKAGQPVPGDAHVGEDDGVVGDRGGEGVEEGELLGVFGPEAREGAIAHRGEVGPGLARVFDAVGEERARGLRIAFDHQVGRVVLRGVGRVDVDGDEARGGGMRQSCVFMPSRSLPTATTRSASSQSAPASGTCGGRPTASGWSPATPAAGVRGEDRRAEALGQRGDPGARVARAAAGPDERAVRGGEDVLRARRSSP